MPRVLAVCVVHQLRPEAGTAGVTAIDKRPVARGAKVGPYGVRGDVQANRKHHGGLDKAVYAYAQEDAVYWERELDRELPPGWFGENLRVEGLDVNTASAPTSVSCGPAPCGRAMRSRSLQRRRARRDCSTGTARRRRTTDAPGSVLVRSRARGIRSLRCGVSAL